MFVLISGLICRALPRGSPHAELKERTVLSGSIMQGKVLPVWKAGINSIHRNPLLGMVSVLRVELILLDTFYVCICDTPYVKLIYKYCLFFF